MQTTAISFLKWVAFGQINLQRGPDFMPIVKFRNKRSNQGNSISISLCKLKAQ